MNSVHAVARRRDAEVACLCSVLCPRFWLAASFSSLLFLVEQNKEVHVLFSSCEMECLLSVDCTRFSEGKLRATCIEGHSFLFFKKQANKQK